MNETVVKIKFSEELMRRWDRDRKGKAEVKYAVRLIAQIHLNHCLAVRVLQLYKSIKITNERTEYPPKNAGRFCRCIWVKTSPFF